jgi:phosphonate transport system substrate-binding protein
MKIHLVIIVMLAVILGLAVPLWLLVKRPEPPLAPAPVAGGATLPSDRVLRLDITPERDPMEQRHRYQALAQYLSGKLDRRVTFSVVNTYQAVLDDLAAKEADGGFVGSMVGALALDRLGAKVLVKPQTFDGVSTYRGVVFVPESSHIKTIDDLAGHTLGMVRATTAGDLFPILLLHEAHLLDRADAPRQVWCGTHDEVVENVLEGRIDAGAVKNLRLAAVLEAHPAWKLRMLGVSDPVPNNALIVCGDLPPDFCSRLQAVLLAMGDDPAGRTVLNAMHVERFVPCAAREYAPIYDMSRRLGPDWNRVGVEGPAPRGAPAAAPAENP